MTESPWNRELVWIAGVALLGIVCGLAADRVAVGLAVGLLVYSARHVYFLVNLSRLLARDKYRSHPTPDGLWAVAFARSERLFKRSQKRKRRLSRFITRFNDAASALPDAAIILGRRGDIEWCNHAAESLLGLDWPACAGELLESLVKNPALGELLTPSESQSPVEIPSPSDPGKVLSLQSRPFGRKHQRLLTARDVTRVYHLDRTRRDFVANVSHELRTPLTVIRGYLETLEDEAQDTELVTRSVERMQAQLYRMQNIVDDLLMLSRLELSDEPERPSPVSMSDLVNRVALEAQQLPEFEDHRLDVMVDTGHGLVGDEEELYSALSNLVFNAVRHTPTKTDIQVQWHVGESGGELTVRDTGPGIASRHIPRLTERFYRVDASRSRATGGTGLGLAIVRHVLEHYGARLQIVSAPGRGSSFTCRFPPSAVTTLE
jgi:two-component system phosphate regulon sensor histidine kinase PhoR